MVGRGEKTSKSPTSQAPHILQEVAYDKSVTKKISAVSRHHIVHLKYIQFLLVNYTSAKLKKEEKKNIR